MKKYFMTAALALVLGGMAFALPAEAQSGKVFGVQQNKAELQTGTAVVQPGFTDRKREHRIMAGQVMPLVNPGFYSQRRNIFDYWNIHSALPANFNAKTVGLTSNEELLNIFHNARKIGQARVAFLCGLRGDVSKYNFDKTDYWSLRFANVDALKNFVFGYFNNYIYGADRADYIAHRSAAADVSDFIFYSAKEAEAFRQDMIQYKADMIK